jgi:hypothetical protein
MRPGLCGCSGLGMLLMALGWLVGVGQVEGLQQLTAPFHRPFQYIGMSIANAAKATGGTPNAVGNIVIDSD